ncbi:stage II sporulation protein M [Nocardia terpenica]|uniref:stage II sporulation protein M n=1 Tax=Nocardia terpenica TaxID=455432 RepID=UPI001894724B|nr:stage II sporulation protein M [Nocardia terpenica]MBF6066020.1 stage II sporulation protein M [Nocardia terpenica]MBF6109053.1 stage II sporulation protein M [Nocardia terpenica]MBF6116264.1 stage II sporulation protein M [Nocardia terpenica]MBF6123265.1 stage II sporulation protein M [Nocardia terpenica]MBF6156552.1 stage II sporulation protein M [Nocardia terpenica]
MDVDAYAYAHRRSWDRLDRLARQRRLSGPEADELMVLYRRTSQQLARLQSHAPDPELIGGLSAVLARARGRVLGSRVDAWREVGRFFTHRFPAAVYRAWRWWVAVSAVFVCVSAGFAIWVSGSGNARQLLGLPRDTEDLTGPGGAFESYYSDHPHDAFAAQVWTNNAWVAAMALFSGLLVLPALLVLFGNAFNVGVSAGLMADAGRLDSFFGFLLPHGMLELTAVFVAGGAGLKLGWTLIDPGGLSRARALARQGRATATIALGLVAVLLISGLIEGFVTPSGWPAPVRIGIGLLAESAFLAYVFGLGRRAARESIVTDRRIAG